jgi:DNA-binding MarR family transcriptional regulator
MGPQQDRDRAMRRPQPARRKVLTTLHETGPIADRSGRATSRLAEAMGYTSRPVSLSPLLSMLEEDSLVRRDVRGRRCFLIELTAKGSALVDLEEGLDSRRIGSGGDDETGIWGGEIANGQESLPARAAPGPQDLTEPLELMRRELRDVLMAIGAIQHRVAELERLVREKPVSGEAGRAPATTGYFGGARRSGTGRTG